ncbi:MAG: hypothetical protein WCA48_14055 [Pseudomonas gingeri]
MSAELVTEAITAWTYLGEFLKVVPGLILLPISFVVGWKKLGHKAVISYQETYQQFQAPRLTRVVLTNLKDKPLIIHALYADIDHHALFTIKEFETPLVVKGLESVVIETEPVSAYDIDHDPYEPPLSSIKDVYVVTTGKQFRCDIDNTPTVYALAKQGLYKQIKTITYAYLGLTFNDEVRYGLSFSVFGERRAALVGNNGLISGNWPFNVNRLRPEEMETVEAVEKTLNDEYHEFLGDSLIAHELNTKSGNPFVSFKRA